MESKNLLYSLYYSWWKNIDKFIFSLIILLFLVGLFFSLVSTSLIVSDNLDTNDYSFFFKHLFFIILGITVIFIFSSIDQKKLFKYSIVVFFISLVFLLLVPLIGIEVKALTSMPIKGTSNKKTNEIKKTTIEYLKSFF